MTQLPSDDEQWQEFLQQHRSTPPPAADDLEDQLMNAIEESEKPAQGWRRWHTSPAIAQQSERLIAAALLMAWSGYRALIPLPALSNSASLEAFMENNWYGVVGETPPRSQSSSAEDDWMLLANTTH
jgi:hypothetical protein